MIDKKEEFRTWLQHPCTKIFQDVLKRRREEFWQSAIDRTYQNYHRNEKDPQATILFGKVDGFDTILGVLKYCQEQIEEEIKYKGVDEKDHPEIEDSIGEFLEEVKDEK